MHVRRATADDRAVSVRTAARAFVGDPFIRHLLPDDDRYEAHAEAFFGLLFDVRLAGGDLWCTDDGAAVAQWTPPGGNRRGDAWVDEQFDAATGSMHELTYERMEALDALLAPGWPAEPHWYLGVLATDPGAPGRGLGSAVLAPGLARADADGLAAYLVTATEANVAFYRRRGFGVHVEVDLPDGPHVWMLERRPSAPPDAT